MFGTAAAISFAFTAAMTKVVAGIVASDWTMLYRHWQTYGLVIFGVLAVFLAQNAYHAGPIVASQSAIVLVDPLASILIGVGLFGDNLRTGGALGSPRGALPARHVRRGLLAGPFALDRRNEEAKTTNITSCWRREHGQSGVSRVPCAIRRFVALNLVGCSDSADDGTGLIRGKAWTRQRAPTK